MQPEDGQTQAPESFVVHALSVADGILALCQLPGVSGDYETDMGHIRDWQPGLVISMTTLSEMEAAGAATLGQDVQRSASRWVHLPIEDFSAPDAEILARWPAVSHAARKALVGGGRVLVHCKGGCGRSGMVVLRLMIECGESPPKALARLRALRPCAVETPEQMSWAYGERRVAHPPGQAQSDMEL
ncbi:MAG: protein phosphatase [Rhodobacteraceae bacterium]|nr:protein phosphatase [Paracoccaceae bacterium]